MEDNKEAKVEGKGMPTGKVFGMSVEELTMIVGAVMENKEAAKSMIEAFKPVIGEAVDLVLDTAGPEVSKVMTRVALGVADVRKAVYDKYIENGFTEDQAMQLLLADIAYSKQVNESISKAAKK